MSAVLARLISATLMATSASAGSNNLRGSSTSATAASSAAGCTPTSGWQKRQIQWREYCLKADIFNDVVSTVQLGDCDENDAAQFWNSDGGEVTLAAAEDSRGFTPYCSACRCWNVASAAAGPAYSPYVVQGQVQVSRCQSGGEGSQWSAPPSGSKRFEVHAATELGSWQMRLLQGSGGSIQESETQGMRCLRVNSTVETYPNGSSWNMSRLVFADCAVDSDERQLFKFRGC
eukprot:TRINITY_DN26467_c0_g1_i1.p2 TRINITY_DN26467_c0_g1~~TRINITY_DN26467_c0_g1_i1.p2  ORF type:complete len:253 (+),score=50.73 TRINITY_DN26467_c0_g1_i1:66-761(+)